MLLYPIIVTVIISYPIPHSKKKAESLPIEKINRRFADRAAFISPEKISQNFFNFPFFCPYFVPVDLL